MKINAAVCVKDVVKSYGGKKVLAGLSMTVERGTIYGLLGASGCGKTTLLSCIVGRKSIESGEVWVLGGIPGEEGSGVPGPKVGYMTQELGLVEEFTVKDAIYYFGRIFNMKDECIKSRMDELTTLFDLPPGNRYLKNCSGGQQRRVSFAASLVHSPELLILDEPTAGVDPILREKIWNYLLEIVAQQNTAVIITTHYIEETKGAHKIGLMRKGTLLAEESPSTLLSIFQTDKLEAVFLMLSQKQEDGKPNEAVNTIDREQTRNSMLAAASTTTSVDSLAVAYGSKDELTKSEDKKNRNMKKTSMSSFSLNKNRIKSLMDKNWKQFYRNIGGMAFLLTFPILQLWFFINSIGGDPKGLNLGIVNDESMTSLCTNFNLNETAQPFGYGECHFTNLSCRFLTHLEHPMISKIYYQSLSNAFDDVKHGKLIGVLYLSDNFTESYEARLYQGGSSEKWITDFGSIRAYMDMSNRQTGVTLRYKLHNLFMNFQEELLSDCKLSKKLGNIPVQTNFLYGNNDEPYSVYMTPGMIITMTFLLGSTMTSQIIITDRNDGVWDRSIVAGVSSLEITLTHFILQGSVLFFESIECILMMFFIYQTEYFGSIWIMFFISYIEGICGMVYGFFVSVVCENHTQANILVTGGYLPMLILCGIIWPIEAMPLWLRILSLCLPFTMAVESFRNVMKKGFTFWNSQVINGVGITVGWILFLSFVSVLLIKKKK